MNQKGFSYIELVASLAIFLVVSATMLANFREGDRSEQLRKSAELLASYFRETQTRSITGYGGVNINGYGIRGLNNNSAFREYADDVSSASPNRYDSGEEVISPGLLENVRVSGTFDIFFAKPAGDVYEAGVLTTGTATATILHIQTGQSIDVTVNGTSGQVNVGDPY
ncbi:MAG: pilus assembly FimT family protein [Patescibacteria group bacterium]